MTIIQNLIRDGENLTILDRTNYGGGFPTKDSRTMLEISMSLVKLRVAYAGL